MPRLPDGRLIITAAETAFLEELRQMEERTLRVVDAMRDEKLADQPAYDPRWLAIATTHFQEGYAAMGRALVRPVRVALPEDSLPEPELPDEDQFDDDTEDNRPTPGEDSTTAAAEPDERSELEVLRDRLAALEESQLAREG